MARESLRVLLIDSDLSFLDAVSCEFLAKKHRIVTADSGERAVVQVKKAPFDVIVVGSRLADGPGHELLKGLGARGLSAAVVFVSDDREIGSVIEAFRAGAVDCLVKPCTPQDLVLRCRLATEKASQVLRDDLSVRRERRLIDSEMIGASPAIIRLRRLIERVAPSDKPVLIEGESGTGKELVALAVLRASGRARSPFVTVNCAALPESLLESEFFGHEKGAFTGATSTKEGLFDAADGGTIFVDEIGELAPALQAKLLRVLEDGSFRRVGSIKERKVDVRLIAATNRDLTAAAVAGRFREDLYYRINVLNLQVPPLRERRADIRLLTEAFLGGGWVVERSAMDVVERYPWPGNVRQLKNTIERAKVFADGSVIRLCDLPVDVASLAETADHPRSEKDDIYVLNREHVLHVLTREKGNKAHAARALGIHRRTLYRMLERWSAADERHPVEQVS